MENQNSRREIRLRQIADPEKKEHCFKEGPFRGAPDRSHLLGARAPQVRRSARCTTSHPLLHEALGGIQQLYDLEDWARAWEAADRLRLREREAVPILDLLQARFDAVAPAAVPPLRLRSSRETERPPSGPLPTRGPPTVMWLR